MSYNHILKITLEMLQAGDLCSEIAEFFTVYYGVSEGTAWRAIGEALSKVKLVQSHY